MHAVLPDPHRLPDDTSVCRAVCTRSSAEWYRRRSCRHLTLHHFVKQGGLGLLTQDAHQVFLRYLHIALLEFDADEPTAQSQSFVAFATNPGKGRKNRLAGIGPEL